MKKFIILILAGLGALSLVGIFIDGWKVNTQTTEKETTPSGSTN